MKKIIVISSLLVMFMFLVSCAPQITNEELEAELAKLTPEQREELLADLESKGGSAFAGQAVRQESTLKYGISKAASTAPTAQIKTAVNKLSTQGPAVADTSVEGKAIQFCNKPENAGKKTHYCSEFGNTEIKYDRFRCAGNSPIHVIDTTYKKSLLYPQVDTCQEILASFLDQPDYATVGCYDSDGGGVEKLSDGTHPHAAKVGYVEIIQLQTGNKAPTAPSTAANPIKEVDACSGSEVKSEVIDVDDNIGWYVYGCSVGYNGEGYPPAGYVGPETPCLWHMYSKLLDSYSYNALYGTYLFERKCPALFVNPAVEQNTKMFHCGYETGYNCFKGTCDGSIPAMSYGNKNTPPAPCKGNVKCKEEGPVSIKLP